MSTRTSSGWPKALTAPQATDAVEPFTPNASETSTAAPAGRAPASKQAIARAVQVHVDCIGILLGGSARDRVAQLVDRARQDVVDGALPAARVAAAARVGEVERARRVHET